jgi:8-oxo-dGTP diphosphatase
MTIEADFHGAKLALFCGARLLTLQRDDLEGLPWRGQWDLPGGGREGEEDPETCALRELAEEFGLTLSVDRLQWKVKLPSVKDPSRPAWLFAGFLTPAEIGSIRFGSEGQGWRMMDLHSFLTHPDAITAMQVRARMAGAALNITG